MNDPHHADPEKLRRIYRETDIKRSPITGIVSGYHTLPFTLIGPNDETEETPEQRHGSLKLTGQISVSPKLVIPNPQDERIADMFPEIEPFMDPTLTSRAFSFSLGYRKNNLRIRNEHLAVEAFPNPGGELMEKVLDELNRGEIVNMGVIWCPAPRFYPVSLERFIVSVLDREFR